MSRLSAVEAQSFLHAFLMFFGGEFSNFDDVYVHGVGISGFGGSGEGMVGLVSGFGVPFGALFGVLPLGLERNSLLIPAIDGGRDSVHRHDLVHEGEGDAGREISDKDVLVGDTCEGGVVLEVGDILNESWCLNAVSNFVMKSGKVPIVMVVLEMVFCLKVVAQVRADPLVM